MILYTTLKQLYKLLIIQSYNVGSILNNSPANIFHVQTDVVNSFTQITHWHPGVSFWQVK